MPARGRNPFSLPPRVSPLRGPARADRARRPEACHRGLSSLPLWRERESPGVGWGRPRRGESAQAAAVAGARPAPGSPSPRGCEGASGARGAARCGGDRRGWGELSLGKRERPAVAARWLGVHGCLFSVPNVTSSRAGAFRPALPFFCEWLRTAQSE